MIMYTVDLFLRVSAHRIEHLVQFYVVSEEIYFLGLESVDEFVLEKSKFYVEDISNVLYTVQQKLIDY